MHLLDAVRVASFLAEARLRSSIAHRTGSQARFGVWLRTAMVANGTTFIKAGQFLSSRSDILPASVTQELRSLQDCVNPMPFSEVQKAVEAAQGAPLWEVFEHFEAAPVASASIGQVHVARVRGGGKVAVKVQRPRLREDFGRNLEAVRALVRVARALGAEGAEDSFRVLDDLESQLLAETDFAVEADNMRRFARLARRKFGWLRVPEPVPSMCTRELLVMEFVGADFKSTGVPNSFAPRCITAHRLVEMLLWMILDGGLVHCDMHPGNVGFTAGGKMVLYDFGTVLEVDDAQRDTMREVAAFMYEGDAAGAVRAMLASGMIRLKEGRSAEEATRFFAAIIDITRETWDVKEVQESLKQVPPFIASMSLFRLFKTVLLVESACKAMDPDFNYFTYMRPYLGPLLAMTGRAE